MVETPLQMEPRMSAWYQDRFFGSLVALAALFFISLGDAFLLAWRIEAGARTDIAARGAFLVAAMLPIFAVVVGIITVVVALFAGHRRNIDLASRIVPAMGATLLAFGMLYLTPFDPAWLVIAPVRQLLGLNGSIVLDVLLIAVALRFAFGHRWPFPSFDRDVREVVGPATTTEG